MFTVSHIFVSSLIYMVSVVLCTLKKLKWKYFFSGDAYKM